MGKKFFKREELIGKLVIDQEARITGKVKDLAITEDGKVALLTNGEEALDTMTDLDYVQKIGDVVLLKAEKPTLTEVPTPPIESEPELEPSVKPSANICQNCNHVNKPASKFCVKCGKTI